jgi:AAA15 family ATPase/GTPase
MLVQFSVKNYKSFKDEVKLSMVASNYDDTRMADNVIDVPKFNLKLLRSAAIYGANASGKSKLLEAMDFMRSFILTSSKETQAIEPIKTDPFRLSSENENAPSLFEINFIFEDELYRYGFEVTKKEVVSEWLYMRANTKEVEMFYRDYQKFEIHPKYKQAKFIVANDTVRENALLLSVAAQFNDKIAKKILVWLDKFRVLFGLQESRYMGDSIGMLQNEESKAKVLQFMKGADFNIEDLKPVTVNIEELPKEMPEELRAFLVDKMKDGDSSFFSDVSVFHKKYDENRNPIIGNQRFSMDEEESAGTRKYFSFAGRLIKAIEEGNTLMIDELDAKLHPNLVLKIAETFNSIETNPNNAQLIFNTHDDNLLSSGIFRRDQIWFTEKDRYGVSTLFSLDSFRNENGEKPRKEEDYARNYIRGKYGAIPYLSDFNKLFLTQKEVTDEKKR